MKVSLKERENLREILLFELNFKRRTFFGVFEMNFTSNQMIKLKIQIFECSKLFRIKNATIKIAKKNAKRLTK